MSNWLSVKSIAVLLPSASLCSKDISFTTSTSDEEEEEEEEEDDEEDDEEDEDQDGPSLKEPRAFRRNPWATASLSAELMNGQSS
jgi:hypothetical protein